MARAVAHSPAAPAAKAGASLGRAAREASLPLLVTNQQLACIEVNDAAAAFLGYDRDELLRMTVDQIVVRREREELVRASRGLEQQRFRAGSTRIRRKNGEVVAVNFVSVDAGGDRIPTLLWPVLA